MIRLRPLSADDGLDDPALTGEWSAAFTAYVPRSPPWCDYLALDGERPVGTGGFKAPPVEGRAEIGYLTFLDERGRGVAKLIARSLVELGRANELRVIVAHTLPEENGSTAVLRSEGFSCCGSVEDSDDGTIWRWELDLT